MSERPWYRRYPSDFISGTLRMSLEEKGAYSIVLDLIYDRGGPIPDEPRFIAGVCGCSVRKWNSIRQKLLELGKLMLVPDGITNFRAEKELEISAKTSRELAESGRKGGEKSAENRGANNENKGLSQAGLKHTRASSLPIPFKKEAKPILEGKKDEPPTVRLERNRDDKIFRACDDELEARSGKRVPGFLSVYMFPVEIFDKANAALLATDDPKPEENVA